MNNLVNPNTIITLKRHNLSIGRDVSEVAIIRKKNDEVFDFKSVKKGTALAKIRKNFSPHFASDEQFYLSNMSRKDIERVIEILNHIPTKK